MKHYPTLAHGDFREVLDGIWFIQGAVKMPMWLPMTISRSMTVIRIPGTDELVAINSMRLTDAGFAELDRLGRVTHVLRVGGFHGRDDGVYRDRYGARVWAIEGQRYTRSMKASEGSTYLEPDGYLNAESELPLPDARLVVLSSSNPPEALLHLERDGGILVTGDSLQNTASPDRFVSFVGRVMMRRMGFYQPYQVGPAWLEFAKPSEAEVRGVADLKFEHVLPGHGDPVLGSAREKYLPTLRGELRGCHGAGSTAAA